MTMQEGPRRPRPEGSYRTTINAPKTLSLTYLTDMARSHIFQNREQINIRITSGENTVPLSGALLRSVVSPEQEVDVCQSIAKAMKDADSVIIEVEKPLFNDFRN